MTLTTQLQQLRMTADDEKRRRLAEALLQQATTTLLRSQRFYGEVLLRLPRQISTDQPMAMGLWTVPELALRVNPQLLGEQCATADDLLAMLAHEIGHLAWQHPVRYAGQTGKLVQLATDLAIDEVLPVRPPNVMSRAQLNYRWQLHLAPGLGSAEYLTALRRAMVTESTGGQAATSLTNQMQTMQATHIGWQPTRPEVVDQMSRLTATAWQQTPLKQRGTLPSQLQQQLAITSQPLQISWQQLIRRGLQGALKLHQPAYYRFNRRQPYQMGLPGEALSPTLKILIFVDQSGSMTDAEVQLILGQIQTLLRRYQDWVWVIPFDAAVHESARQRLRQAVQLNRKRFAGGGTAYQPIFNWLAQHHDQDQTALAVILTDGHGESRVDQHGFQNVIWGLTTAKSDLSVSRPMGQVTVIRPGGATHANS